MGDELTVALTNAERLAHYRTQTGSEALTPAQRRRVNKNARQALSPHANVARASRLRKAWIRSGYVGEMRRGTLANRLLRKFRRKASLDRRRAVREGKLAPPVGHQNIHQAIKEGASHARNRRVRHQGPRRHRRGACADRRAP